MSKEERKISMLDIQVVQNLIERCLQLYMSQSEVMSGLLDYAKIEPDFTELVWQNLEAENQEFFRAYRLRLMVKDQILRFNELLEKQHQLTHHIATGAVSLPMQNGSHIHSMHNSAYQGPEPSVPFMKTEDVHQVIGMIPNVYADRTHPVQPSMLVNMMGHGGRVDMPSDLLLARNSNAGMMQGLNGGTVKPERGYVDNAPIMFAADENLIEPHNRIGGASISPLNGLGPSGRALHETMLDPVTNSFGLSWNFSLSNLTADFSNSADIMGSYSRSPFLGIDANFLDPHIREEQQDIGRLDTTSEGFSYKDFGSD